MSEALDTSVVVRLLTNRPSAQADAALQYVNSLQSPAAVSDLVVGEAYYALRHHYDVPHADALEALHTLLRDPRIYASGLAPQVLAQMQNSTKPGLIDRMICADYDQDGFATVTFDRDLSRLPTARLLPHHR